MHKLERVEAELHIAGQDLAVEEVTLQKSRFGRGSVSFSREDKRGLIYFFSALVRSISSARVCFL